MYVSIICACMSTLPGFLAHAKVYGKSVYKSLRTFMLNSRTNDSKMGSTSENTEVELSAPGKTYIKLEDGAKAGVLDGGIHSTDKIPLWGEP